MPARRICQFKVVLKGSHPPIWRRLQIDGSMSLAMLHRAIQAVMGWHDVHLHEFRIQGNFFGTPLPENEDILTNEKAVPILKALRCRGARAVYVYDFADDWRHEVVLERIVDAEDGVVYPVCRGGKGACPPDDSGSMENYYLGLEVMKHPEHPAYAETVAKFGEGWDPAAFDVDQVNHRLRAFFE